MFKIPLPFDDTSWTGWILNAFFVGAVTSFSLYYLSLFVHDESEAQSGAMFGAMLGFSAMLATGRRPNTAKRSYQAGDQQRSAGCLVVGVLFLYFVLPPLWKHFVLG